jgi:plastocyanin
MMSKKTIALLTAPCIALAALTLLAVSGCGKHESGAYTKSTVTVKKEDLFVPEPTGGIGDDVADDGQATSKGGPGSFVGSVTLDGAAPGPQILVAEGKASRDPAICAAKMPIPNQKLLVDASSKGVANVFVYMERLPRGLKASPVPEEKVIFDQENCTFKPHAMIVRAEQTMFVINSDGTAHNTHTFPSRNTPFSQTIAPNDKTGLEMTYRRGEKDIVRVVCDFHAWMSAYHLPIDHQFAALTGKDGTFRIDGLPPGKYRFRIWHEAAGDLERSFDVTIKAEEETKKDFKYPRARFAEFRGKKPKIVRLVAGR